MLLRGCAAQPVTRSDKEINLLLWLGFSLFSLFCEFSLQQDISNVRNVAMKFRENMIYIYMKSFQEILTRSQRDKETLSLDENQEHEFLSHSWTQPHKSAIGNM